MITTGYKTFTRGTWAPLMKPYFGLKAISTSDQKNPCLDDEPDDGTVSSLEIVSFEGYCRNSAVEII